jgi:hypothetical protein
MAYGASQCHYAEDFVNSTDDSSCESITKHDPEPRWIESDDEWDRRVLGIQKSSFSRTGQEHIIGSTSLVVFWSRELGTTRIR